MGAESRTLKLPDAGLAALQHFAELECWGPFFNSSMIKSFHRACVAAGLPQREMLMHALSSRMMDRYTMAGVESRLRLAAGAFNRSLKAPKWLAVTAGSTRPTGRKTA